MATTWYHTVNGELLGDTTSASRTSYLTDGLGSVTATQNPAGTTTATWRYKPFGALLAKTGAGTDPRFLWTASLGVRCNEARGAEHYTRARHYSNVIGLWTSSDRFWPSQRRFLYVRQRVTTATDSTGNEVDQSPVRPSLPSPPDFASDDPTSCQPWQECCKGADHYFNHVIHDRCRKGWVSCPGATDLSRSCDALTQSDCESLERTILGIAGRCVDMCGQSGGGGYPGGTQVDAHAFCCVFDHGRKVKGCEVRCCKGFVDGLNPSDPASACMAKCLLLHEQRHLDECNKLPPVNGQPPFNECCAYSEQMECLLVMWAAKCKAKPLPPSVGRCRMFAVKYQCKARY